MLHKIGTVVAHVAGASLLAALVAQLVFLASTMLMLAGLESPLVVRSLSNDGYTTVYHGNLQYILPASIAAVLPVSYLIGKRREGVRNIASAYLYGAVAAAVVLVAAHPAFYLGACHGCAELACGLSGVQECSTRLSWMLAEALCRCK